MAKTFSRNRLITGAALVVSIQGAAALHAQVPVVDCVVQNPQTTELVAYFGYSANLQPLVNIPLGSANALAGGILVGSIPTTFASLAEHILFGVRFYPPNTVSWTLNSATATANAGMASNCQVRVGQPITQYVAQCRCWDLLGTNTCEAAGDLDLDGYCTLLDCVGVNGTQGNAGPKGASGAQGPVGPGGAVPVFQTVTASPGAARATASCAATQFLVTGGGSCDVPNLSGMGRVASSAPSDPGTGWSVSCNAGQATAIAVCANK